MAAPVRPYGLIFPKKIKNTVALTKHSIFDDSDDETSVNESLQKESLKKKMMKQTKLEIQKALEDDATVFEYDSVYDNLQKKKLESSTKILSGTNKQPKYIENLLKAVGERKKEQDRRAERIIQKEREAEGEKYIDKDAFVTSAYKKKLQEQAVEKEQERREAEREACLDVTKQKDLSGFYRHFLNQKMGEELIPECSIRGTKGVKEEQTRNYPDENDCKNPAVTSRGPVDKLNQDPDADSDFEIDSGDDEAKNGKRKLVSKTRDDDETSEINDEKERSRQYRKHVESSSDEEQGHHQHSTKEGKSEKSKSHSKSLRDKEKSSKSRESSSHKEHKHEKEKRREKDHGRNEKEHKRCKDSKEQKRTKEEKSKDKDYNTGRDERHRDYREKHKDRDEQKRDEKLKEQERNKMEKHSKKNGGRKEENLREQQEEGNLDKEISEREKEGETPDKNYESGDIKEDGSEKEKPRKHDHKRSRSEEKVNEELSVETGNNEDEGKNPNLPCAQKSKGDPEKEAIGAAHNQPLSKFVKRSNQETITSAKERYLARQMNRAVTKSYIEPEENE
ncbi:nuclear speckle splicing regulatory protein 1 [Scyliorhinus canicula]|uniref:nuclear speckle splicing regulatory protein 1 n=1 Tax=Scyliorhinus canicula TaxID=7830 RepID=UPI0018F42D29|nr:nuclear speckle splicing regulatory protein 1 [Scyliorhinus canicula]